ncbi:MAG: hypothetical protein MZV49_08830 [Rhodopseudomonas palustris]|nr:hypothetical protein [Rhodopseudomonas palustris]
MILGLNDQELESILDAAAEAGARFAGYVLLRLPHEVEPIFQEWLQAQYPLKAAKVLSLIRRCGWRAQRRQVRPPHAGIRSDRRATGATASGRRCRHGFTRESDAGQVLSLVSQLPATP